MLRKTNRHPQYRVKPLCAALLLAFAAQPAIVQHAQANPAGASVASGQAGFAASGNTLTVTNSPGAIINWQSFSIGANEATRFAQQSASSAVLNRVTGADPSSLLGSLQSNGRVFLVNPHGIVFGKGATIDTAGFIASTLDISDRDFLEGRLRFEGGGLGVLRNEGAIRASGDIFLVGPQIENAGLIRSDAGSVLLAAGQSVTISGPDAQGVQFALQAPADSALNLGTIEAKNAAAMFAGTLRHSGEIHANRVTLSATGEAVLEAGSNVAASGEGASVLVWSDDTARAHGTISARGADGKGGFVETSAHTLDVNGIRVDTGGGQWLLDPNDFTIAASGGDITGAALGAALVDNSVTIQTTATTASCTGATCGTGTTGNGDIHVNDAVSWGANTLTLTAVRDININAVMTASGTSALAMNTPGGAVKVGMNGSGFLGRIDFPGLSGTGFLTINGNGFTVINSLGAAGSTTATDLQGMNGGLAGNYALGSDIDATATSGWNAGAGFNPVGSFTGQFNGLGHTIGNLTINRPAQDNVGMFGDVRSQDGFGNYVGPATIANVGLMGGSVIGHSYVGGLVGHGWHSTIYNTFNTGSVTIPWNWWSNGIVAGGLVGQHNGTISRSFATGNVTGNYYGYGGLVGSATGLITDSYATGNVSGPDSTGGLAGSASDVTILRSYASGNVTGGNRSGGLIGYAGRIWIGDGYATGNVTGTSNVGGLVGSIMWASVWNTYATGLVTGSSNVGGLVGGQQPGYLSVISNSFWDTQTSGQATSAYGTGLTTAQMKTAATFTGAAWDPAVWLMSDGAYPTLRALPSCPYGACWTGRASGDWSTPANWFGFHVPTTGNSVYIDAPDSISINYTDAATTSLGSLTSLENLILNSAGGGISVSGATTFGAGTTFTLSGGTATFGGATSLASLDMQGGTLAGSGAVAVSNSFIWSGGIQSGAGSTTVANTATFTVTGAANKWLDTRTLTSNSPTGIWGGLGSITLTGPAAFNNAGVLVMQSDAVMNRSLTGMSFNNSGTLRKNGGTGTTQIGDNAIAFTNSGTVDVVTGTLDFGVAGTQTGTFSVASGATLNFAGPMNLGDGATLSGAGTFNLSSGVGINGTGAGATIAAGTTVPLAGVTLGGAGVLHNLGTLALSGSTISGSLDNQGTLNVSGGASDVGGSTLDMTSGTLNLAAGSSLTKTGGAFNWLGGSFSGTGSLAMAGGAAFNVTGAGARVLNGPALGLGGLTLAGGSLDVRSGSLNLTGPSTINTGATLIASGGSIGSTSTMSVAGTLRAGAGSITATGITVTPSGLLTGNGAVTANVTNNGSVAPGNSASTLTISGNYTQGAGGTLNIELDGTAAGQYDVLTVSGSATLGGTVNFTGVATSGSFPFLTASSIGGTFASQTGALNPTLAYNAGDVTAAFAALGIFWDGGGSDGLWLTPANWSADALPVSTDDVVIAASAGTVTLASGAHSVNSLQCDASLVLSGGSRLTLWDGGGSFGGGLALGAGEALTSYGHLSLNTYTLGAGAKIHIWQSGPGILTIGGQPYTVINGLGAAGSTTGLDLQGMSGNLSTRYALGSDIDASATSAWNGGAGFAPVGDSITNFTGIFDGLGHVIREVTINRPTHDNIGVFGDASGVAAIRNVAIENGSIRGRRGVGGLVGNNAGAITNSHSNADVMSNSGWRDDIGGLVGINTGSIAESSSSGNVTGGGSFDNAVVGGLVGWNNLGSISNSSSSSSVTGHKYVGGLVGAAFGGSIDNSYSTGNVVGRTFESYGSGHNHIGGLVGYTTGSSITGSYATGSVSGGGNVGGLVGDNHNNTITNSYATGTVDAAFDRAGGLVGLNSGSTVANSYATGNVHGRDSVGGLVGVNANAGNVSSSWSSSVVSGENNVGGLIGKNDFTVSNSYSTSSATGINKVGGLIGFNDGGSVVIENTYATGRVRGVSMVGGLVGHQSYGVINDSYSVGGVTGSSVVGGLIGGMAPGTINRSYWDILASGQLNCTSGAAVSGCTGLNSSQMAQQASFAGLDFVGTWGIDPGASSPYLRSNEQVPHPLAGAAQGNNSLYRNSFSTVSANNTRILDDMFLAATPPPTSSGEPGSTEDKGELVCR